MTRIIYLDNAATTPPDPKIISGMAEREASTFGNPASPHQVGRAARALLESSRERLAEALGGRPEEVILTGGGTEANGIAILGSAGDTPGHIAISAVEHASVKESAAYLRDRLGWTIDTLPADAHGRVEVSALPDILTPKTRIVATMLVNGEVGCINDIKAISRAVRRYAPRARHLVDAVQGLGKLDFSVDALGIDCLSVCSHKIHGPKGVGALLRRKGTPLAPIIHGGGHELGLRSGTLNVAGIAGFGEAVARYDRAEAARLAGLRQQLVQQQQLQLHCT